MKKRLLSLALVLCMLMGLVPAAFAASDTTLEKLTPFALRTYNYLSDPDDKPYGHGGPMLESWEPNDKSNTGSTYSSGVKLSTTGSWNISRFAVDYYVNKGYSNFSGAFVLHENVKSSTTAYYVRIIGDGNTLYTSQLMQPGTLPQSFSVDISNITTMTIEAKIATSGSFYNYKYLGVVDAKLSSGSTSTPPVQTPPPEQAQPPVQTPPPATGGNPVGTAYALERFNPLAQRTYDYLTDPDDKPYGHGGPNVESWEPNDLANTGSAYSSGVKLSTTGSWNISRYAVDYYVNRLCNTFTGSFVLHENAKSDTTAYYVRIIGDGNTLYTSQLMQPGTLPQPFSVDISNVTTLTIEAKIADKGSFYNYKYLGVVDAKVYAAGGDPTKPNTPATASGKQLGDLAPLAIRTYDGINDSDDKVYGHGGRDPITWGPSDKANTNGTYSHGVRMTTGGSWSLGRFAYDYLVNRQYKNFSGQLVLGQDAKNNTTAYYVRIIGDGSTLYTSQLMQPGTLPQPFSVDISNVNTLTIEAKCINGSKFYNYTGFGLVNAVLGGGAVTPPPTTTPTPGGSPNPSDPSTSSGSSSWAQGEVGQAIALGFVPAELQGNYQANITRQEFCKLVVQMLMAKSSTLNTQDAFLRAYNVDLNQNPFSDTSDQYVKIAYTLQIVNGTGSGKFSPHQSITRQEAASMLQRAAAVFQFTESTGSPVPFSDKWSVASWASASVDFISANGIMAGSGGAFNPHGYYSREQSILTVLRLFNAFPRSSYAV